MEIERFIDGTRIVLVAWLFVLKQIEFTFSLLVKFVVIDAVEFSVIFFSISFCLCCKCENVDVSNWLQNDLTNIEPDERQTS